VRDIIHDADLMIDQVLLCCAILQCRWRPKWLWSYGSWIYNYLCNQCLSQLRLWVQIPIMARCTR